MIEGSIADRFEAHIEIAIDLPNGDVALIDALIDTGYDISEQGIVFSQTCHVTSYR